MKIGDIVKIRKRENIDVHVYDSPGWDKKMNIYCGKEFKIRKSNQPWVYLENINFYAWHIEWLIDVKKLDYLSDKLFEI